ncbi:MAG: hypothetical protein AVDCRST_MAG16-2397, partial [uncultured Frankineae bacterium]
ADRVPRCGGHRLLGVRPDHRRRPRRAGRAARARLRRAGGRGRERLVRVGGAAPHRHGAGAARAGAATARRAVPGPPGRVRSAHPRGGRALRRLRRPVRRPVVLGRPARRRRQRPGAVGHQRTQRDPELCQGRDRRDQRGAPVAGGAGGHRRGAAPGRAGRRCPGPRTRL